MKIIIVKCSCGNNREIREGEIQADDFPMCDKCFMPMFPERVITKQEPADVNND